VLRSASFLLLAVLLVSGCFGGTTDTTSSSSRQATLDPWQPLQCDASGITTVGNNVDLIPGLVGTADTIAKRIGDALGDPVTEPAAAYEDSPYMQWPTSEGRIVVQLAGPPQSTAARPEGTFSGALYQKDKGTVSVSQVTRMAEALGADPATLKSSGTGGTGQIWQEWNGTRLHWEIYGRSGANWFMPNSAPVREHLNIGPFYTFHLSQPTISGAQAVETARAFMVCKLQAEGHTEAKGYRLNHTKLAGVSVVGNSLTQLVNIHHTTPEYSPCGSWNSRWVFVDAVTGAVRATELAPCI